MVLEELLLELDQLLLLLLGGALERGDQRLLDRLQVGLLLALERLELGDRGALLCADLKRPPGWTTKAPKVRQSARGTHKRRDADHATPRCADGVGRSEGYLTKPSGLGREKVGLGDWMSKSLHLVAAVQPRQLPLSVPLVVHPVRAVDETEQVGAEHDPPQRFEVRVVGVRSIQRPPRVPPNPPKLPVHRVGDEARGEAVRCRWLDVQQAGAARFGIHG